MERSTLRLEIIKLTYSHGRDTAEAVGRARVLEEYILEPKAEVLKLEEVPQKEPSSAKKAGKPNPLS